MEAGPDRVEAWGSEVAVDEVLGHPCKVHVQRPRHLRALLQLGARHGDRTHLVQGERRLSFADLAEAVERVAGQLRAAGARPGDPVMLSGANSLAWVVAFWTCLCNDWVLIPANSWWSGEEIEHAVRTVGVKLLVADRRRRESVPAHLAGLTVLDLETILDTPVTDAPFPDAPLRETASRSEDDPAMVLFTSGTTSFPRGVVLSHRCVLANLQNLLALAGRLPGPDESPRPAGVTLMTTPLFHVGGAQQLLTALVSGATLVFLDDRFSPAQVLRLVGDEKVTMWAAVPTMLSRVLDEYESDPSAYDVSTLRGLVLGGAPVAEALRGRARDTFPNTRRGQGASYGLTEIAGVAASAAGQAVADRPGTVGRAMPTVDLRIDGPDGDGVGEVHIRTPGAMIGYWGAPDDPIFTPDRWLRTGDLGRIDADGYLYIEGRAKDVVIRGGENIAPVRVEGRLLEHRGVAQVAVLGLPHPDFGEEVAAAVVLHPNVTVDESELAAFVAERLAYFAVPTRWWFVSELPVNAAGKVVKKQIADAWPVGAAPR